MVGIPPPDDDDDDDDDGKVADDMKKECMAAAWRGDARIEAEPTELGRRCDWYEPLPLPLPLPLRGPPAAELSECATP